MDYLLFANVFFYIAMLRGFDKYSWDIVKSSVVVALVPFVLALTIRWILSGYDSNIVGLISLADIVTIVLRALAAAVIFYKIRQGDESVMRYFGWGVAGVIVLFYLIPGLVFTLIKM